MMSPLVGEETEMYSVMRFTIDAARVPELLAVGEAMEDAEPGVFDGPRRAGDGFACDVESSPRWSDHVRALEAMTALHAASIRRGVELGASVTFDVAIGADDYEAARHALTLRAPAALLAKLCALGVALEVTIYRGVASATNG